MLKFQAFDAAYLDRLRRGDADTERDFVAYFSQLIRIKVARRVRSASAVEEIRQETLVRAFRAIRADGVLRSPEGLGAFVNSICNHVLLEWLRHETRRAPARALDASSGPDLTAGPEELLLQHERSVQVRRVLEGLSARDRGLLVAVFLEERDKDEVCAELAVTRDYLRVLLHRAKTQFRPVFVRREPAERPAGLAGQGGR